MITQEEKEEIISAAVERTLLAMPDVVGNLLANHAALHKLNKEFYKDHEEFAEHKDVVVSVVEMIEGKNPAMKYEDILKEAVPEIRRRITISKSIDVTTQPSVMPRDFSNVTVSQNGRI